MEVNKLYVAIEWKRVFNTLGGIYRAIYNIQLKCILSSILAVLRSADFGICRGYAEADEFVFHHGIMHAVLMQLPHGNESNVAISCSTF